MPSSSGASVADSTCACSTADGRGAIPRSDARELDIGARVHHDVEPGLLGAGGSVLVDDAQLQPQRLDTEAILLLDGLIHERPHVGTVDEEVHHVNLRPIRDIGK